MFKIQHSFLFGFLLCIQSLNAELPPLEILKQSDAARGNLDGVHWEVTVFENGVEDRRIEVKARGYDMLAQTLSPARQKGHKLLLVQNNMWFFKPGLSKPVPISLRQKLSGRAANGDIASTNYAEDYTIISFTEDSYENVPCYRFTLDAASSSVTYARIHYWVSKEQLVGLRADYYNASGSKRLKTATMRYDNQVVIDGIAQPFISELTIRDDLKSEESTRLTFSEPKLGDISARTFSLQAMSR